MRRDEQSGTQNERMHHMVDTVTRISLITLCIMTWIVLAVIPWVSAENGRAGGFKDWMLVIIIGPILVFYIYYMYLKREKKLRGVDETLDTLKHFDPIWDKEKIILFTKEEFKGIMNAWSNKDREFLKTHLTPELYKEWMIMVGKMDELGQTNLLNNLSVEEVILVDVEDFTDDTQDHYTASIIGSAKDHTVDADGNWVRPGWSKDAEPNPRMEVQYFARLWTFYRSGDSWKLSKVDHGSAEWSYIKSKIIRSDKKYAPLVDIEVEKAKQKEEN